MAPRMIDRRFLVTGGAAVFASNPGWAQAPATLDPPRLVSVAEQPSEILDAWVDAYGRPTAKVEINGQGPFNFLVDTGSNSTVVTQRIADAVSAPTLGLVNVHGTTGSMQMPLAMIDHLSTGVASLRRIRAAVLPNVRMPREDGILGADAFAGKRLTFDILNKEVRVSSSQARRRLPSEVALRFRSQMLAEIDGAVGAIPARMMLDTGAHTCLLNEELALRIQKAHPRLKRIDKVFVQGVTGHRLVGDLLELPLVRMGAYSLRDSFAVVVEAPVFKVWGLEGEPVLIVGINILSRLSSFSIDYGSRHFEATPLASLPGEFNTLIG